ncbi:prolipoprotein diacylglyceryl transferase [Candidatus Gracilibacteria bacterium]|nr:prolipoprotein diacylglyceryl transferase [Candidatus Gracilibacteria bacterium]
MQHIENISSFFIMTDYNFSLFGAIFGFCLILLLNTRLLKKSVHKYIDGFTLAFLFTIIFGFIGLFLSGSGYGESTTSWLGIPYISNSLSATPTGKFLPIALLYSGLSFMLFSILYILSMYIKVRGLIGYLGIGVFSAITLILEYYSAKPDAFSVSYDISFSQIWAIIFIIISFYGIYRVMNISGKSQKTILGDVNN